MKVDLSRMLPIRKFRAFYTGIRIFDGVTHDDWCKLPPEGFVYGVLVHDDPYRTHPQGYDWIWWTGKKWGAIASEGPINSGIWLPKPPVRSIWIKRGDAVSNDEFNLILAMANEWSKKHA